MKLPKITFSKYNWSRSCYRPTFNKYWSGKIWNFSIYKYGISIDFRGGFQMTDLLNDKEKKLLDGFLSGREHLKEEIKKVQEQRRFF